MEGLKSEKERTTEFTMNDMCKTQQQELHYDLVIQRGQLTIHDLVGRKTKHALALNGRLMDRGWGRLDIQFPKGQKDVPKAECAEQLERTVREQIKHHKKDRYLDNAALMPG